MSSQSARASLPEGPMLAVEVATMGGEAKTYECRAGSSLLELKACVAADLQEPTARLKLLHGARVLPNDAPLSELAADGRANLQVVKEYERALPGFVRTLSGSHSTWEAAWDELLRELVQEGVQQGQVLWIDLHNKGPSAPSVVAAYYSPDLPARGPLQLARAFRAGNSWEELYAWAGREAEGRELVSISGASSWVRGSSKVMGLFFCEGETRPAAPVEHVRAAGGSWWAAAHGILLALQDRGVERGQLLGVDAHNDGPDGEAVFAAHFCRGLRGRGRLALKAECSANEIADWFTLERRAAGQCAGRELVSATGSSNCERRTVLFTFWQVPDEPLQLCLVEAAGWPAAAQELAARLSQLGLLRSQVVSIDAQNKGPGQPCVLCCHYRPASAEGEPLRLAWLLREGNSDWSYLCGWAHGVAGGRDLISITGASGTMADGSRGLSQLLFYQEGEAMQPRQWDCVRSTEGAWNPAADRVVEALRRARVGPRELLSINACNVHPDAAAEFHAHFCRQDGAPEPGRLTYTCFNANASWQALHRQVAVSSAGKEVVSITGSSNCAGRSVVYAFYWEDNGTP